MSVTRPRLNENLKQWTKFYGFNESLWQSLCQPLSRSVRVGLLKIMLCSLSFQKQWRNHIFLHKDLLGKWDKGDRPIGHFLCTWLWRIDNSMNSDVAACQSKTKCKKTIPRGIWCPSTFHWFQKFLCHAWHCRKSHQEPSIFAVLTRFHISVFTHLSQAQQHQNVGTWHR